MAALTPQGSTGPSKFGANLRNVVQSCVRYVTRYLLLHKCNHRAIPPGEETREVVDEIEEREAPVASLRSSSTRRMTTRLPATAHEEEALKKKSKDDEEDLATPSFD